MVQEFQYEHEKVDTVKLQNYRNKYRTQVEKPLNPNMCLVRKPGKYRVVELITWTNMVASAATLQPDVWECYEPVTLPKFDISTPEGRSNARAYLYIVDPDLVVIADPCTAWSRMNLNMNQRTLIKDGICKLRKNMLGRFWCLSRRW